ncbi:MAG: hypothetical protein OXG78_15775 [Chloroflexi bacterium]|nr:hypothetical protein [Chloroflexota bacterium]
MDEKIGESAQIPYLTARYFYSGNYIHFFGGLQRIRREEIKLPGKQV